MVEQEDPFSGSRMSLGEHIEELRKRLIRGGLAVLIAFFVGWTFYEDVARVVMRPMHEVLHKIDAEQVKAKEALLAADPSLKRSTYFVDDDPTTKKLRPEFTVSQRPAAFGFGEGFWFALKISLLFSLFLGAPVLLWQMWQFIAAGLYDHERRTVLHYFPASIGLFLAGVLFGFFVMVPYGFYFLATAFSPEDVELKPRLSEYLQLLSSLTLALGLVFQLPLVMNVFIRLGLVEVATLRKYRAHFIVASFVIAAILTPPDPITQSLMAIPMIVLYQLGLWWGMLTRRSQAQPAGATA